jgi:hypothetical protein
LVVQVPALQIGDGRGFLLLVGPVDDQQAEEIRPSGFEDSLGAGKIPDLVLVALVVGRAAQLGRWLGEEEAVFRGIAAEDSEFLAVIGRTALKARNCFAAASELFNVCLERDSRSSVARFMRGKSGGSGFTKV